ncbi:outer membrane protein assembly factor BamE [Sphingomonas sp. LaA6.9]|uniref:outer membrane protein assembly factor BamE n=1 Tax=Sphingomonas sp. LaA6.9 TaxID=2919914 RepID=UPI001F4F3B2A|nr:outer membrane protein assembly factor BamE [Sphingomonas sp. LaA6.9]MCJ8158038.1 outer membrane protein assembly factor BamE [Sphingomonas sp. LaA6.9]
MTKRAMPVIAAAVVALIATGGCTRIRAHQGYIVDNQLIEGIKPGVDNRESVEGTLGRPTFVGQFDAADWYYVSRSTKQLAFANPKPAEQTILHVRFDAAGNVAAVDRQGLEKIVSIHPDGNKTPTLGRERGFFQELFGNIGAVGAPGMGGGGQGPQ